MKKTLSFLLVIAMMLSLVIAIVPATAANTPAGTAITSAAEFTGMKGNGTYYLADDITIVNTGTRDAAMMKDFSGTFDGNGHTITIVNYYSLFWRVASAGVVKNVTVAGDITLTGNKTVAGIAFYNEGTIENAISKINITGKNYDAQTNPIGGICAEVESGKNPKFIGCVFDGSIDINTNNKTEDKGTHVGGILGKAISPAGLTITDCVNKANITVNQFAAQVGGIVAWLEHTDATITGCVNEGTLVGSGTKGAHIGFAGIVACAYNGGSASKKVIIKDCVNKGDMSLVQGGMNTHTGGIIGRAYALPYLEIEGCLNAGNITVLNQTGWSAAGGMVGSFMTVATAASMSWSSLDDGATVIIKNCENSGKIYGLDAGGMIGAGMQLCVEGVSITFEGCLNVGTIYSYGNAGGMMGVTSLYSASYGADYGNIKVLNCMNAGFVKGRNFSGGMIGYMNSANANTSLVSEINGCVNLGEIANAYLGEQFKEATVGGMVGQIERPVTVKNCVNLGKLTGPTINPSAVAPMVAANGKTVTASGNVCVDDYSKANANATEKSTADIIKDVANSGIALDDKSLMDAYNGVRDLKGEDYTEESWNALAAACEDSFKLFEKVGVITKKEIEDAAKKITKATTALVPFTTAE